MKNLYILSAFLFFISVGTVAVTSSALALDFYGADIADKDAPSSFMKMGIYGFRPTITEVRDDTYAGKAGFLTGDIILAINDKQTKKASDLNSATADTLNVTVFRGNERIKLSINSLAIKTEKAARLEAERKIIATRKKNIDIEPKDNDSPAIKFDNAALDAKYGKTSPAEMARQQKNADRISKEYRNAMELRNSEENRKREDENRKREDENRKREDENKNLELLKLSKIDCTGILGECGTGRVCLITSRLGRSVGKGRCSVEAEADRIISEENQERRHRQLMNKIDEIKE